MLRTQGACEHPLTHTQLHCHNMRHTSVHTNPAWVTLPLAMPYRTRSQQPSPGACLSDARRVCMYAYDDFVPVFDGFQESSYRVRMVEAGVGPQLVRVITDTACDAKTRASAAALWYVSCAAPCPCITMHVRIRATANLCSLRVRVCGAQWRVGQGTCT